MNKKWIKNFYNKLIEAELSGEDSKIEQCLNYKKENLPRYIYKYRSCNKYAFDDLFNNFVHLSHPTEFNDPLDCISVCTQEQAVLLNLLNQNKDEEEDFLGLKKHLWPDDFCEIVKEKLLKGASYKNIYIQRMQEMMPFSKYELTNYYRRAKEELDAIVLKISDDYKKEVLLCSFAATVKNNLMWSHYAKSHTGFCIEYDLTELEKSSMFLHALYPIIYSKKPLLADIKAINYNEPIKDMFTVMNKSADWNYEQEYRLFCSGDIYDYPMPIIPSRIYLGLNISERNQNKIIKYAKEHYIEVRKMAICASSFNLTHQRVY